MVTQNSGDTCDARCSNDEEQHTHHDFNESEDTFLRCCNTHNPIISFSCHSIRKGNTYYCIFVLGVFDRLKMLANLLSHHSTSNRAVMAFCSAKEESQNNLSEMSGG